jgi:chemotaxis protein histidine kinase CheA
VDNELFDIVARTSDLLQAFDATRLDNLIRKHVPAVASLAQELGKATPKIIFETTHFYIKNEICDILQDALTHLIRNALDHGIEMPAERREKNKPERGEILITTRQSEVGLTITISDDGRGI